MLIRDQETMMHEKVLKCPLSGIFKLNFHESANLNLTLSNLQYCHL
jgi:hypothetical protein